MYKTIEILNGGGWADWSLCKLEIDYEKVEVIVSSDNEKNIVTILCKDYIGFTFVGHWDESIIEDIRIETSGNLIDDSLQTVKKLYGENPLPGGGVKKIEDVWYQLNIKLIDGNVIKVACKNIEATIV
jgi:hypothetical protein